MPRLRDYPSLTIDNTIPGKPPDGDSRTRGLNRSPWGDNCRFDQLDCSTRGDLRRIARFSLIQPRSLQNLKNVFILSSFFKAVCTAASGAGSPTLWTRQAAIFASVRGRSRTYSSRQMALATRVAMSRSSASSGVSTWPAVHARCISRISRSVLEGIRFKLRVDLSRMAIRHNLKIRAGRQAQ